MVAPTSIVKPLSLKRGLCITSVPVFPSLVGRGSCRVDTTKGVTYVSSHEKLPTPREIYASGGGLVMASINTS